MHKARLGHARRRTLRRGVAVAAIATLLGAIHVGSSGATLTGSGFEGNDANLAVNTAGNMDWNGFSPTWTGNAPYKTATATANGWTFAGLSDAQAATSDTGFAGGTKQDDNCPTVIGSKAPNKDDVKRVYVATKVGSNGHVYLALGWARIPQNTTSPSAHVAFEFNQATATPTAACGSSSGGLFRRVDGDLLALYDFTGGSSSAPSISVERWVTSPSATCEVSNDAPPCWGTESTLAASTAEAAVDTGAVGLPASVVDNVAPASETLGKNEFGEAAIDLTAAGIFPSNTCQTFGKVWAVSRTSGDSAKAAMEDLVGPGSLNVTNCGRVKVIKHTDPRGIDKTFTFTTNIPSGSASGAATYSKTPDTTGATTTFSLNDKDNVASDNTVNTEDITNVLPGHYTVTEGTEPSGFALEGLSCTPSDTTGTSYGQQHGAGSPQADITIAAGGTVTCTYQNQQQLGAIKVTKTSSKGGAALQGAVFDISTDAADAHTVATLTTNASGVACTDGLAFGTYYVTEKTAPTGYAIDDSTANAVTVNTNATCADTTYVGATRAFTDTPLSTIEVKFWSQSNTTSATITCKNESGTTITPDTGSTAGSDQTYSNLVPNSDANHNYTCTVNIDP
jgi:hypothetical protein